MGNFVIWDYLSQFPGTTKITARVCISQGPSGLTADGWEHGFIDKAGLRDLVRASQGGYAGVYAGVATILTKGLPSPENQRWMTDEPLKTLPNTAVCIITDQTQRDYRDVLMELDIPILAVWGRDEKCLPVAADEWLAQHAKADLRTFEGSGHRPMCGESKVVNHHITQWIEGLGADSADDT